MNDKLLSLCKKFIENRDVFKSIYKMESAYLYPVCAAIFASGEKTVDAQTIRACGDLLKKKVSSFSSFRGTSRIVMISMLASDSDPEARLDGALNAYTSLKKHFFAGNYLPLAAMILSGELPENEFDGISERTREIYDLMRSEHPFLTSGEDCVFAMLLALSGQRPGDIVTEVERCYRILKGKFFSANAVQSLSHVLALCEGNAEDKCRATAELFDALKANKIKYGTEYELATLGTLAMLPASQSEIISELADVDAFLACQKGYGFFGLGKSQRLMHAGMLVTSAHLSQNGLAESALAVSAQQAAIAAAQQAAICAAIAAQAAANASN